MEFLELLKAMHKEKIRYVLVGGVAVNLHGIIRATKDIDFVIHLEEENLKKFINLMTQLGYKPKVPVDPMEFADPQKRKEWIETKNMIVFCFYHEKDLMKVIDVFVQHPLPFEEMYERRCKIPVGDTIISVANIEDLISLKAQAGRLQDRSDILALRKVQKIEAENNE